MTAKAIRGWRHKKRRTEEQFNREFDAFVDRINKHAFMRRVNGTSYGRPQYIHNGRKP